MFTSEDLAFLQEIFTARCGASSSNPKEDAKKNKNEFECFVPSFIDIPRFLVFQRRIKQGDTETQRHGEERTEQG